MSTEFLTLAEHLGRHPFRITGESDQPMCCECQEGCSGPDGWMLTMEPQDHSEHVAAAWREACTIRTVEQLDALPRDTVVVDAVGIPRTKRHGNSHMPGGWTHAGSSPLTSRELADGRAMVIAWHPDWSKS